MKKNQELRFQIANHVYNKWDIHTLPNFPNDLNAMHNLEEGLTDEEWIKYNNIIFEIWKKKVPKKPCDFNIIHVNAEIRAEAYAKLKGIL
jgi:hypothetical protein